MGRRYELSEQKWESAKELLQSENSGRGCPSKSNRDMLNGIIWIDKSGAPWRDFLERFENHGRQYTNGLQYCYSLR